MASNHHNIDTVNETLHTVHNWKWIQQTLAVAGDEASPVQRERFSRALPWHASAGNAFSTSSSRTISLHCHTMHKPGPCPHVITDEDYVCFSCERQMCRMDIQGWRLPCDDALTFLDNFPNDAAPTISYQQYTNIDWCRGQHWKILPRSYVMLPEGRR